MTRRVIEALFFPLLLGRGAGCVGGGCHVAQRAAKGAALPPVAVSATAPASPPNQATASSVAAPAASSPPPHAMTIRLSSGNSDSGDAEVAAGDEAFERGDLAQASKYYEAARILAPKNVAPRVGVARVRLALASVPLDYGSAKGSKEVAAAAAELAMAVKAAPSFGPGYVELGRARLLLGDASGAVEALETAARLLPDEPEAHSQLGVAWLATGHADRAVSELARAVELDPSSAARHGNLGTALLMVGRTKEAVAEYEVRVRMDDGDARAHSDLGTALLGTQDLPRALSELQRAVALDPKRPAFHSNLGYALQQLGRMDAAIAEYRDALRLDPNLVSAWINLGTVLARNPTARAQAREALVRAQALSPGDPRVKANLDELDALELAGSKGANPR